ncbi:MAG TPA: extracellular solute-binding protein [Firmicutes bacterium]|nr:extracellular solute-binding protein [Bacillota bacterium]
MARGTRELTLVTAVVVGIALVLGAVIPSCSAANPRVTLVHWGYSGHGQGWRDFIDEAAKEFMKLYPDIKIEILVSADTSEYVPKFLSMVAGGAQVDVTEWTAQSASAVGLAQQGYFLDLHQFIGKDKDFDLNLWPSAAISAFTLGNVLWGVPLDLYLWLNWYNEDLFDAAGVMNPNQLGEKWDWDNMVRAAQKLTVDKNGDGQPEQYGIDRVANYWNYGLAVLQAGGWWYDRLQFPTKSRFNSSEVRQALDFCVDLFNKYKVTQHLSLPWSTQQQFFFWTGKTAINITDGPGWPNMATVPFRWDVTQPVKGPGGPRTKVGVTGFQIAAQTKYPNEAWQWVKFLTMRKESVLRWMKQTGRFPALKSAQTEYGTTVPVVAKSWRIMLAVGASQYTSPPDINPVPGMPDRNAILTDVVLGKRSAAEALQTAHETAEAAFQKYAAEQAAAKKN